MNYRRILFVTALLVGALRSASAQQAGRFPFVLPWDDASESVTHVGALNPVPAGGSGFLTARDGHFYDEKGRRLRFFGVNIVGSAAFPAKADAEKVAARLHKFGVNLVRFVGMNAPQIDLHPTDPDRAEPASRDPQRLLPETLDRLDYFLAQLKQRGIYADLTLPGAPPSPRGEGASVASRALSCFDPHSIALQKQAASDLLTHRNPYTNTRYGEEPAIALIEIHPAGSLLAHAWSTALDDLPLAARTELTRQWTHWLKTKYGDTESVKRAWSANDKPFGPNRLQNGNFTQGAEHWTLLQQPAASAKMLLPENVPVPQEATGNVLRIHIAAPGKMKGSLHLVQKGLDLTEGEPYTITFWARSDRSFRLHVATELDKEDNRSIGLNTAIPLTPDWKRYTLAFAATRSEKDHNRLAFWIDTVPENVHENVHANGNGDVNRNVNGKVDGNVNENNEGNVDLADLRLRPGVETELPPGLRLEEGAVPLGRPAASPAGQDWIAFLLETERATLTTLRDYLKNDLKCRANITGTQVSEGGLGGALRETGSDFVTVQAIYAPVRLFNEPMVRGMEDEPLTYMASQRIAGKPFVVSAYGHTARSDYQAEAVPMLAAFAAMQDWDGIVLDDYNEDPALWNADRIKSALAIDTNPAQMIFLPAAALLFLRNDMSLANEELRLRVPAENVVELMAKYGAANSAEWDAAGIKRIDATTKRLSLSFAPGKKPESRPPSRAGSHPEELLNKPSASGPIDWQRSAEKPFFSADSPSSKALVGFLDGKTGSVPGWQVQITEGGRPFAALMLTALDGKPIESSRSLLLTAAGRVENTGMPWNADHTALGEVWGTGPTLAEGVSATILLRTVVTYATVYALDATGKRLGPVASQLHGGALTFAIGPEHKTLWYEIEAGFKR